MDGRKMLMLGSNNYLGLTFHPEDREAAKKAIDNTARAAPEAGSLTEP